MNSPDLSAPRVEGQHDVNHRTHSHGALSSGARLCGAVPMRKHPVTGKVLERPAQGKHRAGIGTISVEGLVKRLSEQQNRTRLVVVKSLDDVR